MKHTESQSVGKFWLMSQMIKWRNLMNPPRLVLDEAGVSEGQFVVDYGCGPGEHSLEAARMVGPEGRVFAMDIQPEAIKAVKQLMADQQMDHVHTVHTDCNTGLDDGAIDVVFCYDAWHHLPDKEEMLAEWRRILKGDGILAVNDHHLEDQVLIQQLTQSGKFKLKASLKRSCLFSPRR